MQLDSQTSAILEGTLDDAGSSSIDGNAEAVDLRVLGEQKNFCEGCGCGGCGGCGCE